MVLPERPFNRVESNQSLSALPLGVVVDHHLFLDHKGVQEVSSLFQGLFDDRRFVAFAIVSNGFLQGCDVIQRLLGCDIFDGQATSLAGAGIEFGKR